MDLVHGKLADVEEHTQQLAEQEKQKKIELLARRALGRIRNNLTLKAFTAWHTNTVERVRRQNLARRAIGRIRNVCMVAAFARWAGAVRSARKKRHDTQLEEQALQLQQVLSRLDPDGDGVVTEDEFTQWAKEQALRVQHWEQRLEDVLSELSEQVEKSVDQDVLSERLARVETQLKQQISGAADELAEEIG